MPQLTDTVPAFTIAVLINVMKRLATPIFLLLVAAAVLCYAAQFRVSHFGPLVTGAVLLIAVCILRPRWRWLCLTLLILMPALLGVDAFLLRHRLAVAMRAWEPPFDTTTIEDVIVSPSGRTTIYIIGSHWIDSSYRAYISDGHCFPQRAYLETKGADSLYPRDITASWNGSLFSVQEQFLALRYDENSGHLETFSE